ncbi:MAG: hypothetical protein WCP85_04770 [Mariniphaga sp.]
MAFRIISVIVLVVGLLHSPTLKAQDKLPENWNAEKIRGTRLVPYPAAEGNPYLTEKFLNGVIEFNDGEKIQEVGLRYSCYRDEILYFNKAISTQIVMDKLSLKGFSFVDENGMPRVFRKLYYDGFMSGFRFFEVLSEGDLSLLVYRKVGLLVCDVYLDDSGKQKNMSYQKDYSYFFYSPDKGYTFVRINKSSFLSKFDKPDQILVKKILRKNRVTISDENSFVRAWNLIKENGIKINLNNN